MAAYEYVPNDLLGRLVGLRLYAVQFVLDYVQLHFDGHDHPVLTCDVMPAVETVNGSFTDGQPEYADAVRSLVSATVVRTEEATGQGLRITFDAGHLHLHPTPADLVGPEIATLTGFADGRWMCWRPGEDSFEDLA